MINPKEDKFQKIIGENNQMSKTQIELCNFIAYGVGNATVQSRAGSGKSKTIELMCAAINPRKKILIISHNNHIAKHLQKKLKDKENIDVCTYHSLGFKILKTKFKNIELKEDKYFDYLTHNLDELSGNAWSLLSSPQRRRYKTNIIKLLDFSRYNEAQSVKEILRVANKYGLQLINNECDVVRKMLQWGSTNIEKIDFQDMIWLPYELGIKANIKFLQYDVIFVDEAQDSSLIQQNLIDICKNRATRFVLFGDSFQCQPAGTKVLLIDGTEKNIEDIVVGDRVVTYSKNDSGFYPYYKNGDKGGFKVTKTAERYVDKTIKITTENGLSSEYSYDHICYAKFDREACENKYVVYLMTNEYGMWRIGKSKLFKETSAVSGNFGPTIRMNYENCSKLWILDVFDDNKSAMLAESFISAKFGIPQTIFNPDRTWNSSMTNEEIKKYYDEYLGDITDRAIECLSYFNKSINCPFSEKGSNVKHARDHMFTIYACNLFENIMSVNYYDKNNLRTRTKNNKNKKRPGIHKSYKCAYSKISKIDRLNERKKVYSLEIEKKQNYVADKILTHNCINSWCGADTEAFEKFEKLDNMREFHLSVSYRCSKRVADKVRQIVPDFETPDFAKEGEVNYNAHISEIKEGDLVLCRLTAPLVKLHMKLLSGNKPSKVTGLAIGRELISILNEYKTDNINEIINQLYIGLFDTWDSIAKINQCSLKDVVCEPLIMEEYDKILAIQAVSEGITNKQEVINRLNDIFVSDIETDDNDVITNDLIHLSTVHRAKGLECNNVFILCPSLMPSKLARVEWEIESEKNIVYVAWSRAKNTLNFISEQEFPPENGYSGIDDMYNELIKLKPIYCK